jgi:hypothetical protein
MENNMSDESQELEPTVNEQIEEPTASGDVPFSGMAFNRKFRRMLLKRAGYVKAKKRLVFNEWFDNIKNNIQNGKQLHANNVEENINNMRKQHDQRNESAAAWLLEKGYSEEAAGDIIEKNNEILFSISKKKIKK